MRPSSSNKNKDIFQIARQLSEKNETQIKQSHNDSYQQEVQKIITAYCKVQQIKRPSYKKIQFQKEKSSSIHSKNGDNSSKNKSVHQSVSSQYSKKIKQTLKQININRNKEKNLIKIRGESYQNKNQEICIVKKQQIKQEEKNLQSNSAKKIWNIISSIAKRSQKYTILHLKKMMQQQNEYYNNLITYWRLNRVFNAWKDQSVYMKIQKQRIKKQRDQRDEKNKIVALQFRQYMLLKKHIDAWKRFAYKIKKQKIIQQQNRRYQIQQILNQENNNNQNIDHSRQKNKIVKHNENLQIKLRGFLDGLKQKIQDKRLKTIKQNTQESQVRKSQLQQQQKQFTEIHEQEEGQNQHNQQDHVQQLNEENNNNQLPFSKKPLSNQQLQQRRKQLANRAKARKQTLQKKRKQKQEQKLRIQNQRKQIQKQIQLEQKKIKQQQYRQFQRKKHEQQQWQKKQKQLMQRAEQFSRLRIMKYFGFDKWKSLKQQNKSKYRHFARKLLYCVLKMNFQQVCERLNERAEQNLQKKYKKMEIIYKKNLKKKVINRLEINKKEELQYKQELNIRHQVHTLKIYFKQWFRVQPTLRLQNVQYYRPRIKKADQLRNITLMIKCLKGLKQNKDQQQKNKNIIQHKNRIKQKVKQWVQQVDVDIDQYL